MTLALNEDSFEGYTDGRYDLDRRSPGNADYDAGYDAGCRDRQAVES